MCSNQTVPNLTLQAAVVMVVNEFAQQGKVFSRHDITAALRNKAANGEIEIPECEVNGPSFRYSIQHAKVKQVFLDLYNTGYFDPSFTLGEQYNNAGGYFEYTPSNVSTGAPTYQTATPAPAPTAPPAAPVAPTPSVPVTKLDPNTVAARVTYYLGTCRGKNYRPTLKQVQSAIKRDQSTGWTCEELRSLIEKTLGYSVVDNPDKESSTQVIV